MVSGNTRWLCEVVTKWPLSVNSIFHRMLSSAYSNRVIFSDSLSSNTHPCNMAEGHPRFEHSIAQCLKVWYCTLLYINLALQWRHNVCDGVSNHQPHDCLLNRLFRRRSKKASKLRVTGLCAGNSPVIGEFPAQMASNAENASISWRHHGCEFTVTAHDNCCTRETCLTQRVVLLPLNNYHI